MRELAELQRRFHAVATGTVPLDEAADLIAGDHARLGVYRRMYRDRLVDAIAADYPKLVTLLGPRWPELAERYLRVCAPAHPDIREAGRRLAEFLATTGGTWDADLARLEWARSDVFFGGDSIPLGRDRLAALDPAQFPSLRLRLVPAHAVVVLASNADDVWSAIEDGVEPPPPCPASRSVLVWRRDATTVVHRTLDEDEGTCVELLARGTAFSAICDALAATRDPAERAIELLLRWIDAELLDAAADEVRSLEVASR